MHHPLNGNHGQYLHGAQPAVPEGDLDSASDDSQHSDQSSVISINSVEIAEHFEDRHGRLFHSHGNMYAYPLPADDREIVRIEHIHEVIKETLGGRSYFGPFEDLINATTAEGQRCRIVDLCTGSGKWVDEVAEMFPMAKFYGVDIVPLATRFPAPNVQYEVMDVNSALRWATRRIDIVHLRQTRMAVHSYNRLVGEIARILRPGGLLLSGEWSHRIFVENGGNLRHSAPGIFEFFRVIGRFIAVHSVDPVIAQALEADGRFVNIEENEFNVPLDDSPRGQRMKLVIEEYGESLRPLLLESGVLDERIDILLEGMQNEIENTRGLSVRYHTVQAQRA